MAVADPVLHLHCEGLPLLGGVLTAGCRKDERCTCICCVLCTCALHENEEQRWASMGCGWGGVKGKEKKHRGLQACKIYPSAISLLKLSFQCHDYPCDDLVIGLPLGLQKLD